MKKSPNNLNRRQFINLMSKTAVSSFLFSTLYYRSGLSKINTTRMNILFIDNEDFTTAAIGCYGNHLVKTPNLDRLAANDVLFRRAYCNAVMCNASRASFLTGLRPETTNVYHNEQPLSQNVPEYATHLGEVLKNRKDVFIANVGKLYHSTNYAKEQLKVFHRLEFTDLPPNYQGISK